MTQNKFPINRETWLTLAVGQIEPIFNEKGYFLSKIRVSCAFPCGARRSSVVGQCWGTSFSTDGFNEIFITPIFDKTLDVLDTLTHELVHAVDNCEHRHGAEFKKIALSVGLEGKMIYASAGENLKRRLELIASICGIKIYDDFAHHPTAIRKTIKAIRGILANQETEVGFHRLLIVFEPGSNSMKLGVGKKQLSASFKEVDNLYVYNGSISWDINSVLYDKGKKVFIDDKIENIIQRLLADVRSGDTVVFMSNGDFKGILPSFEKALKSRQLSSKI